MKTEDFIYRIAPAMVKADEDHNISAAMSIQQGIIESASGEATAKDMYSGVDGNNLFGIKWKEKHTSRFPFNYCKTKEWNPIKKVYETIIAKFIRFKDWDESLDFHTELLLKPRYDRVRTAKNWWEATQAIKDCEYATSPTYTNTLRYGILQHKLYTYDFVESFKRKITPNFQWGEFFSTVRFKGKDHKRVIEPTTLQREWVIKGAKNLQIISDINGNLPLYVSSSVRIPEYNSLLATASADSNHLYGKAFDIVPLFSVAYDKLIHDAKENTEFKGFIIYNKWIHLDFRNVLYIKDNRR